MDRILSMKMESKDVLDERRHQTDIFCMDSRVFNVTTIDQIKSNLDIDLYKKQKRLL